jgi:hypothetical protein
VPADLTPACAEALHAKVVDEASAAQRTHRRLERGARLERAEIQRAWLGGGGGERRRQGASY